MVAAAVEVEDVVVVVVVVIAVVVAAEPDWYKLMVQTPLFHQFQEQEIALQRITHPQPVASPPGHGLLHLLSSILDPALAFAVLAQKHSLPLPVSSHFPNRDSTHFSTPAMENPRALQVSTHFLMVIVES